MKGKKNEFIDWIVSLSHNPPFIGWNPFIPLTLSFFFNFSFVCYYLPTKVVIHLTLPLPPPQYVSNSIEIIRLKREWKIPFDIHFNLISFQKNSSEFCFIVCFLNNYLRMVYITIILLYFYFQSILSLEN